MNVLVIAPHPDDETIGCGGTLCIHAENGDQISVAFLTSGELGLKHLAREEAWNIREAEARRAAAILNLAHISFFRCSDWMLAEEVTKAASLLRPVLKDQQPQLIYLPHPEDDHPDHRAALPILRSALEGLGLPNLSLRFYEVWTPLAKYETVQDITSAMDRKLRALGEHKSQLEQFDYVRAITGLNSYRGALAAKSKFAEVFGEPVDFKY